MVTTRRGNGTPIKPNPAPSLSQSASPNNPLATSTMDSSTAFLPTPLESLLLTLYPLTLILGSLFSHLSPTTNPPLNTSTYSVAHQSFQPGSAAPSYFARKSNVFNVYFVKLGWLWTTLALAVFTLSSTSARRRLHLSTRQRLARQTPSAAATPPTATTDALLALHPLARYIVASTLWLLVTQWCFGPALIDRTFALSGGACSLADPTSARRSIAHASSRLACKAAGGVWLGGHDISGHVFLLVLGSGVLWLELLPVVFARVRGLSGGRVVRDRDGAARAVDGGGAAAGKVEFGSDGDGDGDVEADAALALGTKVALAVAALSWWMLLMTAAFFHTWAEKLTGLLVALAGLYLIYGLPRAVPALRAVLGMPGT